MISVPNCVGTNVIAMLLIKFKFHLTHHSTSMIWSEAQAKRSLSEPPGQCIKNVTQSDKVDI
eukprot:7737090-Karenia_brevis.AAC.1